MEKESIKKLLVATTGKSKSDGDQLKKDTVKGTFHIGSLTGNRLNSGTLRSQFIVCEDSDDWTESSPSAKRSLYSDQRVFVQVGDDVWDVYRGYDLSTETHDPVLMNNGQKGLSHLIQEAVTETGGSGSSIEVGQLQKIYFGAPGTGKSRKTKGETEKWKDNVFRTTFHPDSDYSSFVGAYKPTMSNDAGLIEVYKGSGTSRVLDATHEVKKGISYEFVPQAFIKAYVLAWKKMAEPHDDLSVDPVFLVIEEINRGNCAQIFGDLFQLLDRDDDGYSEYPIDADDDLKRYLGGDNVLGELCIANIIKCGAPKDMVSKISEGKKIVLPPNLYIRATMNTSDQSLFPIDSAFKRRWDWEYVPIRDEGRGWYVKVGEDKYQWWSFLEKINEIVFEETQSADKQLGYFFVKLPGVQKEISLDKFVNKVAFYLWNDVFKDCEIREDALKLKDESGKVGAPIKFTDFFRSKSSEIDEQVVKNLFEGLGVDKE